MKVSRSCIVWNHKEDEILRRMAEANASPVLIAAKLRRTAKAVAGRAKKLGVKIRSYHAYERGAADLTLNQ